DAEPGEQRAEHRHLHEQPRDEPLVRLGAGATRLLHHALQQRREEQQEEQRLEQADDHPDGLADLELELAGEDQPGVAKELPHRLPPLVAAGSSRSDRPVLARKTSSRLGRCSSTERSAIPSSSRRRRICGIAAAPASTYRRSVFSTGSMPRTYGSPSSSLRAMALAPLSPRVTTSPAISRLSWAG